MIDRDIATLLLLAVSNKSPADVLIVLSADEDTTIPPGHIQK